MPIFRQDRLYAALLNTGLQNKDPALYQVVYQLIGSFNKLADAFGLAISPSGSGGGSIGLQGPQGLSGTPGMPGIDGQDADVWWPMFAQSAGASTSVATNSMVPFYIAPTETFIIPDYKQALFAMPIDNEGILQIDGFLIEVD